MQPADNFTVIRPDELVAGRPFTDLSQSATDLQALIYMASRLRDTVLSTTPTSPGIIEASGPNNRYLRIVLCQPVKLTFDDTFVVGFFGQKRSDAEPGLLTQVDDTLVKGLADTPYVISYSSLQLEDGNYGNLVVLSEEAGRESWRENKTHQYAVAELTPGYYESVRLHNGLMRGALGPNPTIELTSTKYFDYRDGFWCGLREL